MLIHLLENTVDITWIVNFSKKMVEINRQCGFIPKKNWSISTVHVPSFQKKIGRRLILTVEVGMDSKNCEH